MKTALELTQFVGWTVVFGSMFALGWTGLSTTPRMDVWFSALGIVMLTLVAVGRLLR